LLFASCSYSRSLVTRSRIKQLVFAALQIILVIAIIFDGGKPTMVRFVCGNCGQKFKAAKEYAGQASQCPACGNMVQIPAPGQAAAAIENVAIPMQSEPENKLDIFKFRPAFEENGPSPEQNMPAIDSTPVPEAPKLKMKPRASLELNGNASPASAIKMPSLAKVSAAAFSGLAKPPAAPKQAFPVGFAASKPKLPPGLRLVEEDES
jgi:DNA-directed RNA polymerase subunit RPC12/RpoP